MRSLGLVWGWGLIATVACAPPDADIAREDAPLKARGIYLPVPYEHARVSGAVDTLVGRGAKSPWFIGAGDPPLPIYLNGSGGTYSPGPDDSRQNTSIIPNGTSTVDPFGGSAAEFQQVVDCITDQFAPFNVVIVTQEPAGGQYIESVIGGYPQQVGLGGGVGGVAPIDTFNCRVIGNAIVFTFSNVFGDDPQTTCEVAAQEIAHAVSLDHEFHCPDPMTYLSGCGDKTFRDYDADCGEYSARQCECNRPTQNSVQVMLDKLGPNTGVPPPPPVNDPIPPEISIQSPADGATLPQDSTITVSAIASDDMGLAAVELFWQFSNTVFSCPGTSGGGAVTCTQSGGTSTWSIRVGQGARTFYAQARDVGGNVTQTPAFTINLGTGVPPPPNDTTPPVVTLVSPAAGARLPANSTIQIEANATDENGLAAVELNWTFAQDSFPCPFTGQGVSCVQNGDQYVWSVAVGVGTRRFSVRATDLSGNVTDTPEIDVTLETEMPPPPNTDTVAEENDNPSQAYPSRCGTAIDLVVSGSDEDWFSYEAPAGVRIELGVVATAGTVIGVEMYDAAGTQQLNGSQDILGGGGTVQATSLGPIVLARVTTPGEAVSYRLSATCAAPDPMNPDPMDPMNPMNPKPEDPGATDGPRRLAEVSGGCSASGTHAGLGGGALEPILLLGALLIFRRRRATS